MTANVRERWLRPAVLLLAALAMLLPVSVQAQAWADRVSPLQSEIAGRVKDLRNFYAARQYRPLWFTTSGLPTAAAALFLEDLRSARLDAIDSAMFRPDRLARLLDKTRSGDMDNVAEAELELSRAFARYVSAMRGAAHVPMTYESVALEPVVPTSVSTLEAAGQAPSLDDYVAGMQWMHPLYAPLRQALDDPRYTENERRLIATNLARVRAIPALSGGRHILVDAAGAKLWMYEDNKPVDWMKVVVGKPELQTPMMAGFVRSAILNPYWNVPDDLVRTNIAQNVLANGTKWLTANGYQVFKSWDDMATPLSPAKLDWRAIRVGTAVVHVRQMPGGTNFMGKVKFEFPNPVGIYLHDTPDKALMFKEARQLSSGCVRMEDAARMHRWLMGKPLPIGLKSAEQRVALPQPVPIYITYLTAMPDGTGQIAFHADPYTRDNFQFAAVGPSNNLANRP
ncbi:MAG: L,D-transpeptidase family protein [Croceibacterium sp.]